MRAAGFLGHLFHPPFRRWNSSLKPEIRLHLQVNVWGNVSLRSFSLDINLKAYFNLRMELFGWKLISLPIFLLWKTELCPRASGSHYGELDGGGGGGGSQKGQEGGMLGTLPEWFQSLGFLSYIIYFLLISNWYQSISIDWSWSRFQSQEQCGGGGGGGGGRTPSPPPSPQSSFPHLIFNSPVPPPTNLPFLSFVRASPWFFQSLVLFVQVHPCLVETETL